MDPKNQLMWRFCILQARLPANPKLNGQRHVYQIGVSPQVDENLNSVNLSRTAELSMGSGVSSIGWGTSILWMTGEPHL